MLTVQDTPQKLGRQTLTDRQTLTNGRVGVSGPLPITLTDDSFAKLRYLRPFLEGLILELATFLVGLVFVSDREDSGFYFKTTAAWDIT